MFVVLLGRRFLAVLSFFADMEANELFVVDVDVTAVVVVDIV